MCTMFSKLQRMSGWSDDKQRRWCEAVEHMEFVAKLYCKQMTEGRWFLHEHPATASSWDLEAIKKLEREEGVVIIVADQCMYGLKTWGFEKRS